MPPLRSLLLRLLFAFVAVALLPVGTAALLIHRATTPAFQTYSDARAAADAQTVAVQVDALTGHPAVVVNANQEVIAGSVGIGNAYPEPGPPPEAGAIVSNPETGAADSSTISADAGAETSADVYGAAGTGDAETTMETAPASVQITLPGVPDSRFLGEMTRALLIATGLAAGGALLLSWLLARQIVKPVTLLTAAAEGMAGGDLARRVPVHSRDELGVLAGAFNAMADGRARLEGLRRNLVNDVAHELRTPLANLQGYLELLRDGLTPPSPAVIATLHDEAMLLGRLVGDLQELALAEAGELPLAPTPTPVAAAVAGAIGALQPLAEERRVRLAAAVPEPLPPLLADPVRLGQILRNLLRNAIAHTPPGGEVVISAAVDPAGLAVTVRDTGTGIAPEHLPYVFDRFYRADPARARATGGSGLGLAIVKQLVEAQGGTVTVGSIPGTGTAVTFSLPVAAPAR